ncbi:hypothetical protein GCM10017708_39250 [Arthrobacter citreus]
MSANGGQRRADMPQLKEERWLKSSPRIQRGPRGAGRLHGSPKVTRTAELRKRQRSFIFPMALVFLLWYFAYVLLADYAHDFMSTQVWGNINIG